MRRIAEPGALCSSPSRGGRIRRTLHALLVATSVAALALPPAALAADPGYLPAASDGVGPGDVIDLGLGKSFVVALPRDAKEVFVADPTVVNAVVRSARKAYLIGAGPGQTDVKFIDADGREIASYDVAVSRDVGSIRNSIGRSIDATKVRVEGVGDGIVVTGSVKSAQEADTAISIASGYMADPKKVVNALKVEGQDQVMLKVKVVEIKRNIVKQLGIQYSGDSLSIGSAVLSAATAFQYNATNTTPNNSISLGNKSGSALGTLQALENNGVSRTLAEPTLTAISGETAKFLAGGEFPIVTGYDRDSNTAQITFKQYGIGLNFTPTVLSAGRISLKVAAEVSEIDTSTSVQLGGGYTVPGLVVRRADSTVEIPSGGSIALAGLISQQNKRAVEGLPGLMNVPVLGALFRSNDYKRNETELAIFVTPYLAKAVQAQALASPDDRFAEPSDPSFLLLGRLNRLYGLPGRIDPATEGHPRGGFILD